MRRIEWVLAPSISFQFLIGIKRNFKCSVTKYRLQERLPGVEAIGGWDKDLVYHLQNENKKLISQAEIRWMLNHPELAIKRSKKAWHGVLKFNKTFLGNFKTLLPLVKELNRLGVPGLMDKLCTIYYNSDYPEIKVLWDGWGRVQVTRTGIERGNSPVMLIKRLAAKLGYETVESGSVWNGKSSRMNYILNDLLTTSQYGIIVKSCVNTRLESENLDPAIGDNDWLEVIHPESLQPLHSIQSSPLKRADNTIDIKDTVLEDLAPYQTPKSEPENLDFDKLQPGEILFDNQSQPHQITRFDIRNNMYQTNHKDGYISRNDITTGQYHRATVDDVVALIKKAIKNNNPNQAMWIDKTYGQGKNSLMEQAMTFDDDCCGIYDVMDLVG